MELKLKEIKNIHQDTWLLIVPYGIEIPDKALEAIEEVSLLIVPYGIEINRLSVYS